MEELEKIMLDYIRWIFNLDFCTPFNNEGIENG